jgi:hypothetical protein
VSPLSSELVEQAWIGDAVLSLYVRAAILREGCGVDGERSARMTSNQFLNAVGEPTHVEAKIGRVYQRDGLAAAFAWIDNNLMPVFQRQEENRKRKGKRKTLR